MRKTFLVVAVALVSSFSLASSAQGATYEFVSPSTITITDLASTVGINGIEVATPGVITGVEVELTNVSHTFPTDLDIITEAPNGQFFYLMSDNCSSTPISGLTFSFSDSHSSELGPLAATCASGGGFKPSNEGASPDTWTTAAGAAPADSFASLLGTNQTGIWNLHITDDTVNDTGTIGGWKIRITTTDPIVTPIPSTGTNGAADLLTKQEAGFSRTIADVDVLVNNLTHTYPDDLKMVLASPAGTQVEFMSSNCGATQIVNANFKFDEESPVAMPPAEPCPNSGLFAPALDGAPDLNLAPGFPGPYATNLSAFDGQSANGEWKLLVYDNGVGDIGFIEGFDLAITMRGAKIQKPSNPTLFFKKLGKKSIRATGRVTLSGESLSASECGGAVTSTFQVKSVRKKGKKKITSYKKVVAVNSTITPAAGGTCGYDISAKLPKKYSGKSLRLVTTYLGGDFIAPFTGTTTEKIKKLKF